MDAGPGQGGNEDFAGLDAAPAMVDANAATLPPPDASPACSDWTLDALASGSEIVADDTGALYFTQGGFLVRVDPSSGLRTTVAALSCYPGALLSASDGKLIALCDGKLEAIDRTTGAEEVVSGGAAPPVIVAPYNQTATLAESADGTSIYLTQRLGAGDWTGTVQVVKVVRATGARSVVVTWDDSGFGSTPVVVDGESLLLFGNTSILRASLGTGEKTETPYSGCTPSISGSVGGIARAPDGSLVGTFPVGPRRFSPPYSGEDCAPISRFAADGAIVPLSGLTGSPASWTLHGTGTEPLYPARIAVAPDGAIYTSDRFGLQRVDPATGNRTDLTAHGRGEGPGLVEPSTLHLGDDGMLYVARWSEYAALSGIMRIELSTGNRELVSSQWLGAGPWVAYYNAVRAMALVGDMLYLDEAMYPTFAAEGRARVLSVEVTTGNRSVATAAVDFHHPFSTTTADGKAYRILGRDCVVEVSDTYDYYDTVMDGDGNLISNSRPRTDPCTGENLPARGCGPGGRLRGIAVAPDGRILVSQPDINAILAIDPMTGDRTLFSGAADY